MSTVKLTRRYRCYDDCLPQGCPTHEATLEYQGVSESYCFDDGKGSKICLHPPEVEVLLQMLDEINEIESGQYHSDEEDEKVRYQARMLARGYHPG